MSTSQRASRGFHRLGLIMALATVALYPDLVAAADKIALTCTGDVLTEKGLLEAPTRTLVIDLDEGIVTGSFGSLANTSHTADSIFFKDSSEDGEWVTHGSVDRYSGTAAVTTWRNKRRVANWDLDCKQARQIF